MTQNPSEANLSAAVLARVWEGVCADIIVLERSALPETPDTTGFVTQTLGDIIFTVADLEIEKILATHHAAVAELTRMVAAHNAHPSFPLPPDFNIVCTAIDNRMAAGVEAAVRAAATTAHVLRSRAAAAKEPDDPAPRTIDRLLKLLADVSTETKLAGHVLGFASFTPTKH
jgi:hypothetical protein